MKVRLFFATDVHGSEVCWRKFINSAKHYEVDVLILGGDMTGKAIIPIVETGDHTWQFQMQDISHKIDGKKSSPRPSASSATTATIPCP